MQAEAPSELVIRATEAAAAALEHPKRGRALAEAVAAAARTADEPEALAIALRAAGWAAREVYDHAAADRLIGEAIAVAREHQLGSRLSEALVTRSAIRLEEGRIDSARRAIVEARQRASAQNLPDVAFAEALLEERAGRLPAAAAAYERVVEAAGDGRRDVAAKAYNNWGQVSRNLGDLAGAEMRLQRARALASEFSPMLVAIATHNLAGVAGEVGRPVDSLRRYEEARKLLTEAGLPLGEHYLDKTQTFLALRLLDEAAAAVRRAVVELDVPGGSLLLGEALILQARIAFEQSDYPAAAAAADQAARLLDEQGRSGWKAMATLLSLRARSAAGEPDDAMLQELAVAEADLFAFGDLAGLVDARMLRARVAIEHGDRAGAVAALQDAADMTASGPVLLRIRGRVAQALEARLASDTRRLSRVCRAGLEDLERYRRSFASSELRARAANYGAELAQLGLAAAVASGRAMATWAWLERTRASAIGGAVVDRSSGELVPLLGELREIRRSLEAPATDESQRPSLYRRLAQVERQIRTASWMQEGEEGHEVLSAPTHARLDALRDELGDRALVEFGVVDGSVVAVVVAADRLRLVRLGEAAAVTRAQDNLGFALQRLGRPRSQLGAEAARASADEALATLDDLLVRPLAELVSDHRRIVVVPPGDMIGLPWGSLPALADRALRVAPSALVWAATAGAKPSSSRVVVVEGPGLESAAAEVELVASIHAGAETLMGDEARCARVLEAVEGAGVVHVACHGTLRADSPTFSGFRMADGPLTVHDLESVRSAAHHWVLAACDLGSPGSLSGPDLEGVLASLLSSGAGAVIAAVTVVPDAASAQLMGPLHRELAAGATLAEALRRAKRQLDPSDPLGYVTRAAFNCYGGG